MRKKRLPPLNQGLEKQTHLYKISKEMGPSACQSHLPQEPQDSHCRPRLAHTTAEGP